MNHRHAITCLLVTFLLVVPIATARAQSPDGPYEEPPVRQALEVIPEWMVNGQYWTVDDEVTSFDSLHEFTVRSDWGNFEAYGEPMLRIRLRELEAIGTLKQQTLGKVAGEAAVDGATKMVRDTATVIKHPVKTVKALPRGIFRMFKKTAYTVAEVGGDVVDVGTEVKEGEGDRAADKTGDAAFKYGKRFVGVELQERIWAQKLGIDPYTTNDTLRLELARVGGIDAGTKFAVSLVNPLGSVLPIAVMANVYHVVWEKDHRELAEWIYFRLKEMGVKSEVINALLYSDAVPPGHLTLMVAAMEQLEGVEDRKILASQAAMLETEAEGLFFLECVFMAVWFHTTQAPLESVVEGTLVPVVMTQDGRLIAFSAADWAYWTEENAQLAKDFTAIYAEYSPHRETWISDRITPMFMEGMNGLGWKVRAGMRTAVLPLIPLGLGNEMTRSGVPEDQD